MTTVQCFSDVFSCIGVRQQPRSIESKVNTKEVLNKVLKQRSVGIKKCYGNTFRCNFAELRKCGNKEFLE